MIHDAWNDFGSWWRIILISKWLITMVGKSPKQGCLLSKCPKWLVIGVTNHLLTGMILQVRSYFSELCLLMSKWAMDDHFCTKWRANQQHGWGLNKMDFSMAMSYFKHHRNNPNRKKGRKHGNTPKCFIWFLYLSDCQGSTGVHSTSPYHLPSLKRTSSPLKIRLPRMKFHLPTIHFQGLLLLVSGRVLRGSGYLVSG